MGVEAAEEAGKKAGEESGKEAGAVAGEKVRDCSWLMKDSFEEVPEMILYDINFEGLLMRDTFKMVWGTIDEI